jgi:DNA primase
MSTDLRAQILQLTDLVALISQTVALKRRGRSFVGLCPFHQEKTPSFHVNPERQSFYCFGCKAGGTAFDFVMRRDRVEFRQAMEMLAQQAGVELPRSGRETGRPNERQALLEVCSAACRFFENQLHDSSRGETARQYLIKRGFTRESIKGFQLGLSADAWDALLKGPVGRKYGQDLLVRTGLVKLRESGDGAYDTFRNRILFPIRNETGQIIAFGGRVMPGSTDPAKYLNSPETPLFSKSRSIFGLDRARQNIVESRTVVVVEGYTDVVMAQQYGAMNVVSVLGTALTEHHLAILRRYADRIILLFDADLAGNAAADRAIELYLTQPVEISVATIPDGMDPDEYLLKHGLDAFNAMLAGATDALSYVWKQMHQRFSTQSGDLTAQQNAVKQYLELLASARKSGQVDPLRWGGVLARVARLTDIPAEELHRRFRTTRPARQAQAAAPVRPMNDIHDVGGGPGAVPAADKSERWLLGAVLSEPQRWFHIQSLVALDDFSDPVRRKLAEIIWEHQRHSGEVVFSAIIDALEEDSLKSLAIELAAEVEQMPDLQTAVDGATAYLIHLRATREQRNNYADARKPAVDKADDSAAIEALRKLQERARQADLRRVGA